jgi:predicted GTPase
MHLASRALAAGAGFRLLSPRRTMLMSRRPVVAVCAARTGAGKSQTTRRIATILEGQGLRTVVVRHPMPYGDLAAQRVQRFATHQDLDLHRTTIEEREEYEPHLDAGRIVYAGVDYGAILHAAEGEADVILWDGGNNDLPFYRPDLHVTVVDPLRPGNELTYHPGETNLRLADVVVINKIDSADADALATVRSDIAAANPGAAVIEARSSLSLVGGEIEGRSVVIVEDGPTLTHGGMTYGAGVVAARRFGAARIVDPGPHAVGSIADVLGAYPLLEPLVPAMGYGEAQIRDLEATLTATPADLVLSATPIDLGRLIDPKKAIVRVRYELEEVPETPIEPLLAGVVERARAVLAASA